MQDRFELSVRRLGLEDPDALRSRNGARAESEPMLWDFRGITACARQAAERVADYPLSAPNVSPRTMCFCTSMARMSTGSVMIVAAAVSPPQLISS